jgi:hypothetical protein
MLLPCDRATINKKARETTGLSPVEPCSPD